jgi:hypothetical protein
MVNAAGTICEWGLFSQSSLSGAVMFDRHVFGPIATGGADGIAFTYSLTIVSGA